MTIGNAKDNMIFSLRYLGQDVADIKITDSEATISTKEYHENNKKHFNVDEGLKLENISWSLGKAKLFREHFSTNNPERNSMGGKNNEEHRIESLLLTEFSKKKSENKKILNIQPVKIAGIARFQMVTPLNASNPGQITYPNTKGGGIDILARVGTGLSTRLCVMELKAKKNFAPVSAIKQALVYATFIRELLRSKSGDKWWKIFGFNRNIPKELELYVACALPFNDKIDTSLEGEKIAIDNDIFHLHSVISG